MAIIYGNVFDLKYNNGMFCALIRIASMNKKIFLNICFLELSEEFRRDSKTSSNKP